MKKYLLPSWFKSAIKFIFRPINHVFAEDHIRRSLPITIGIFISVAVLLLWYNLLVSEKADITHLITQEATSVKTEISSRINTRILALERMAKRWQASGGTPRKVWDVDTATYLQDLNGYQAIEWVDANGYVRWVAPANGNEAVLNLDISQNPQQRTALLTARNLRQMTLTPILDLKQGGKGFLVFFPLYTDERFDGYLVGVFQIQSLLDGILPAEISQNYEIAIFAQDQLIYNHGHSSVVDANWLQTSAIHLDGIDWQVKIAPSSTLLQKERSPLATLVLIGGLFVAGILALAVYFAQVARWHHRRIQFINQQLDLNISQLQQTDMALQSTMSFQQAILDSANYTIISTDTNGTICSFNTTAEKWLGYTAVEVVGKTTPAIIHDLDEVVQRAKELSQELNCVIEPGFEVFVAKARLGQIDEQEWTYVAKDGSRFPVLLSVTALQDQKSQLNGFLGIGKNIKRRKEAEQSLLKSESTLSSFFNSGAMMMGIVELHDHDIRHLSDNLTAAQFFGTTPEALKNQFATDLGVERSHLNLWIAHYQEAMQNQAPVKFEYSHLNPDGQKWLSATVYPIESPPGSLPQFSYIVEDITDRKRSKEALEQQLRQTLLLKQITQKIRQSLDTTKIFNTAAIQMGKAFQIDRCAIYSYFSHPSLQIPLVAEYVVADYSNMPEVEILLTGNPYTEKIIAQDQAIATADVYFDDLLTDMQPTFREMGLKSMLAVRISSQENPNGMIVLQQLQPNWVLP
jgi:PAS domain S-box-containing protein